MAKHMAMLGLWIVLFAALLTTHPSAEQLQRCVGFGLGLLVVRQVFRIRKHRADEDQRNEELKRHYHNQEGYDI